MENVICYHGSKPPLKVDGRIVYWVGEMDPGIWVGEFEDGLGLVSKPKKQNISKSLRWAVWEEER